MQVGDLSALIEVYNIFAKFMPVILTIWLIFMSLGILIRIITIILQRTGIIIRFERNEIKPKEHKSYVEIEELKSYCKGCGKEIKPINKACNDCIAFAKLILS